MDVFILNLVGTAFQVYQFCIFFWVISSWFPALRQHSIGQFVGKIVEPFLSIFRRFIPPIGMIDISPIVAIFAYGFLSQFAYFGVARILQFF